MVQLELESAESNRQLEDTPIVETHVSKAVDVKSKSVRPSSFFPGVPAVPYQTSNDSSAQITSTTTTSQSPSNIHSTAQLAFTTSSTIPIPTTTTTTIVTTSTSMSAVKGIVHSTKHTSVFSIVSSSSSKTTSSSPPFQSSTSSNRIIAAISEETDSDESESSSEKLISSAEAVDKLLKEYTDNPKQSMTEIFEKTVELLEKLTGREVPEDLLGFLDKFNQQEEKPKAKTRIQNFKHKKFAQYYRNLDLKLKSANLSATSQANILAALRQQLTATALDSKKLRKKANNLPVYRPVTKIDRENFRSYYKAKIQKMMKSDSDSPLTSDIL